jgi:ABC-type antimicrobial peptide transport system permease subunit
MSEDVPSENIPSVVEDFVDNIYVSKEPRPFIFYATIPERWRQIIVRAEQDDLPDVNSQMEALWTAQFPSKPYESAFQEDMLFEGMRQTNRNLNKIFLFLTILGGVLSASGIFSLAKLNIARRTKEIGIRKALGASIHHVMFLLNKEFIYILIIAGFLGGFGGYYGTSMLLDMIYARHIPMSAIPVVVSALTIILIGLSTTSFTIFRAAGANPVDTLRNE